ncbi:MAG: type II secretion system protein [Thermoleophilia bacterium]|nr:type II secretion system protein [Thermoleophilia bacterium]
MLIATRLKSETGFTLVELLVAIVLLAIIGVVISTVLIGLYHSSTRTHTRARAMQTAVHATDSLQDNLRAAHARYRDAAHVRSADDLRGALLFGEVPRDATVPGGVLDLHDIAKATPTELIFQSDVLTEASGVAVVPECVRWALDASGALVREIRSWSFQCQTLGAPRESAVMMPPNQQKGINPQPFRYVLLRQTQPGLSTAVAVDPSKCVTTAALSATLNRLQRDQVSAIQIDLSSFIVTADTRGDQRLQTTIAVGARQGYDYRFALGCTE